MPNSLPVVVVGAGACGMISAPAAAKRGARVGLVEKGHEPAGNTVRSTGLIPAAGTRFQWDVGVAEDTPELRARDILEKNGHESDPAMTRLPCGESAGVVEWLADEAGCEIVCHTDFLYPGQSLHRMHGPRQGYGADLARQLEAAVQNEPSIQTHPGLPATGLCWEGSRVTGVQTA